MEHKRFLYQLLWGGSVQKSSCTWGCIILVGESSAQILPTCNAAHIAGHTGGKQSHFLTGISSAAKLWRALVIFVWTSSSSENIHILKMFNRSYVYDLILITTATIMLLGFLAWPHQKVESAGLSIYNSV